MLRRFHAAAHDTRSASVFRVVDAVLQIHLKDACVSVATPVRRHVTTRCRDRSRSITRKTVMSKFTLFAAIVSLSIFASVPAFAAEAAPSSCPCPAMQRSAPSATTVAPPPAPAQGQTMVQRSVEPQAAPPVAPRQGTTSRSFSVQPSVPSYQAAPSHSSHSRYRDIEWRRLHPGTKYPF